MYEESFDLRYFLCDVNVKKQMQKKMQINLVSTLFSFGKALFSAKIDFKIYVLNRGFFFVFGNQNFLIWKLSPIGQFLPV